MSKMKKEQKTRNKHYFALEDDVNEIFLKYLKENFIDKQKLLISFVMKHLKDKKLVKE